VRTRDSVRSSGCGRWNVVARETGFCYARPGRMPKGGALNPISLLMDNMITSYGNVAETISVPVPGFGNRQILVQARPARSLSEKWLQSQIEALPTIARLAREGRIILNTYSELEFESQRSKKSFPANLLGNIFADVPISRVKAPIERSYFFQEEMTAYVHKEAQIKFCKWLLAIECSPKRDELVERLSREHVGSFRNLNRFREICHNLHSSLYVDAFHLWTGEINGIEKFLTTDGTFVRALANNRKLKLNCRPIFPTDLLDVLEVKERDPLPFQYGRRYTLNGMPND
jgi:hypothetical protein